MNGTRFLLDQARRQLSESKPFVLYADPNDTLVKGIFQKDKSLWQTDDFNQNGFVFAPFDNSRKAVCLPVEHSDFYEEQWEIEPIEQISDTETSFLEQDKIDFENLVVKILTEIGKGKVQKIVASRKEIYPNQGVDAIATFSLMFSKYPEAFRYVFYHHQIGLWLGATPERLLSINQDILRTMAYAGTQKYQPGKEIVWEQKEREEQQFVTEFILDILKKEAVSFDISEPKTSRAATLLHLRTDITAHLKEGYSLQDIIAKLHPTPAVCGMPKTEAKKFILDNEGYDRGFYTGFLGELNRSGHTNLYVNLRSMEIQSDSLSFYIGCGITKDSNPEKEFLETVNKSVTMKSLFKIENQDKK